MGIYCELLAGSVHRTVRLRLRNNVDENEDGDVVGSGDSYAQAVQALSNAEAALRNLGREFRCGTHHGLCDEYRRLGGGGRSLR